MAKRREYRAILRPDAFPARVEDVINAGPDSTIGILAEDVEATVRDLWRRHADLTSQLKAEEEGRSAHELLAKVAPVALSLANDRGEVEFINDRFTAIFGYTLEDVPTLNAWQEKVFPDEEYRAEVAAGMEKVLRETLQNQPELQTPELRVTCKDGTERTVVISLCRISKRIAAVFDDVTDRKKAEEALKESNEFNAVLLEASPNPIIVTNPDTSIRYTNPAFESLTGFTRHEAVGLKPPYPWWPENEHARFMEENISGRKKDLNQIERCYRKKNGQTFWIASSIKPISMVGGVKCFIANWSDITERKKTEEVLRESEARFRLMMARSPVPMIVNGESEQIEYVNDSFTSTFGYTLDDFPDTDSWWQKVYPEEGYRDYVLSNHRKAAEMARLENRQTDPQEYTLTCKDGSCRVAQVSGSDIGGKRVVVFNDITARRHAEEEIRQSLAMVHMALEGCIKAAAKMVELRDPYTAGHQQRVAWLTGAIATELRLPEEQISYLTMAASVHDIGKIYIPAEILNRTGKLTGPEYAMIQGHVQGGYTILSNIQFPWPIAEIVLQHHERLDGSGYPGGLKGDQIMLEARILAVADTVEAMNAHRPYRPALGQREALGEITRNKGRAYDAAVVEACVNVLQRSGWSVMDLD